MASSRHEDSEHTASDDAFTREELLRKGGAAAAALGLSGALAVPASAFNPTIHPDHRKMSEVAKAVLAHPRVTYRFDKTQDALVIALKDELLVLRAPEYEPEYGELKQQLHRVARKSTTLRDAPIVHAGYDVGLPPGYNVELWRIRNPGKDGDAFVLSRRLRRDVRSIVFPNTRAPIRVPRVSPNHISVVCGYDMCPDGPPRLPLGDVYLPHILAYSPTKNEMSVVVIDTGWIPFDPQNNRKGNRDLSQRGGIASERAWWPDSSKTGVTLREVWRHGGDDDFNTYPDLIRGLDRLAGVAGHGTFVTGILAAGCRYAKITVVAHCHSVLPVPGNAAPIFGVDAMKLFESELAVAGSVLKHRKDAQVISCGFAFPTLDGLGSIPFPPVLASLDEGTAILAPAGNENTTAPYWPAAHERVIGVAATEPNGKAKADFSNWGIWIDCCAPGVDALSTFGYVAAVPQDNATAARGTPATAFKGWAVWNGTCFATPIVTARIASEAAKRNVTPVQAWQDLRDRPRRHRRRVRFAGTTRPFISATYPP
jgi:hypothetical protein